MASIQEKKKNNKIISYKFVCCLGRNVGGGQIRRSITWHIPEGMSQSKMRKAAEQAAEIWEEEVRKEFEKDLQNPERAAIKEITNAKTNFCDFVMNVWFPICVDNGEHKVRTVAFYNQIVMVFMFTFFAYDSAKLQLSKTDLSK